LETLKGLKGLKETQGVVSFPNHQPASLVVDWICPSQARRRSPIPDSKRWRGRSGRTGLSPRTLNGAVREDEAARQSFVFPFPRACASSTDQVSARIAQAITRICSLPHLLPVRPILCQRCHVLLRMADSHRCLDVGLADAPSSSSSALCPRPRPGVGQCRNLNTLSSKSPVLFPESRFIITPSSAAARFPLQCRSKSPSE